MRTLVHLRHAEREAGGVHLTTEGRRAAERLGRGLGRFDRVVASSKPRAVETVRALGLDVDAVLPELEALPAPVARWVDRAAPRSFSDYVSLVGRVAEVRRHAQALAAGWGDQLAALDEGARLLLVSHGGVIELGAVGALGAATRGWGACLGLLEAVQLDREPTGWAGGHVMRRVP